MPNLEGMPMTQGWNTPPGHSQPWGQPRPAWQPPVPPPAAPGPPQALPPQPGWQPPPVPRPPRTPLAAVVLACVGVLALGFVAFAVTSALLGPEPTVGPAPTTPPAASPQPETPPASSPSPEPSSPDPEEPTPSPIEPTPEPTTDDGYDPPPLPQPANVDEAAQWAQANALYDHSATEQNCALARLDDGVPPDDLATFDAFLNRSMDCLMLVWEEPVAAAGFVLPRPPVRSYDQPITTACGTSPSMDMAAAFYCPGDQRIFYAVPRGYYLFTTTSLIIDSTLGHELGHAIQGRIGVLWAEAYLGFEAERDVQLELSRRRELQANCMGGLALNSLSAATGLTALERDQLNMDAYVRGDREGNPRTHGNADSGMRWMADGLDTLDIATCNTFAVPASEVE